MRQAERYETGAVILHWTTAALIAAAFVLGLTVDDFPKAYSTAVVNLHSLIGLAILLLTVMRLAWRLAHRPPELPKSESVFVRQASRLTHLLMYFLMFAVPVIGLPTLFYRGRGLDFGIFQIAPLLPRTPEMFRPLTEVHELAAYALIGLAAGHIAAALYHQYVLRDDLLRRMAIAQR